MKLATVGILMGLAALIVVISAGSQEEWLAANSQKEGVVSLPSGLQYKVLKSGNGGAKPSRSSRVTCHYRGTLIDGTEFDSSYSRGQPATFGVTQVISGWTEALQLMSVGDQWELYIPPNLAYGARSPSPKIPANSALIFKLEILSIA
jgi:FKBP-type peptidyl-prolyl cis-trans isomerase FklB